MARNILLKIIIFALLWVLSVMFFGAQFGGGAAAGITTSMFFIGKSIMGSSLSEDADSLASNIVAFIVTAVVYYIVAELVTLILLKLFGRKE